MARFLSRRIAHLGAVLATIAFGAVGCGSDSASRGASDERGTRLGTQRGAVVGAEPSGSEDDFVLYLRHIGANDTACGSTLVAPNLVVTAKHCLHEGTANVASRCDATGEPTLEDKNGYLSTPRLAASDLAFHAGFDAKKRVDEDNVAPDARGKVIIDDKTLTKCSHDFAFVVLDKALTSLPVARLRLGARPVDGAMVAVAGWGQVEDRILPKIRQRRTGIAIQRVGPAVVPPNPTGSLGPRTFETGPGPCTRDSGGPAFDLQTGTVLGVIARALNTDLGDPVSPCAPATVNVVYMTIADFPKELRTAFAAAGAEPWLEGEAKPGFRRFGEVCSADLECGGGLCEGASASAKGTCNVSCRTTVAGATLACPAGYTCAASGSCIVTPPPSVPTSEPAIQAPEEAPESQADGCSASPRPPHGSSPWALTALAACVAGLLRRRIARAHV